MTLYTLKFVHFCYCVRISQTQHLYFSREEMINDLPYSNTMAKHWAMGIIVVFIAKNRWTYEHMSTIHYFCESLLSSLHLVNALRRQQAFLCVHFCLVHLLQCVQIHGQDQQQWFFLGFQRLLPHVVFLCNKQTIG